MAKSGLGRTYRDSVLGRLGALADLQPETLRGLRNIIRRNRTEMRLERFMERAPKRQRLAWLRECRAQVRLWPISERTRKLKGRA